MVGGGGGELALGTLLLIRVLTIYLDHATAH